MMYELNYNSMYNLYIEYYFVWYKRNDNDPGC